MLLERKIADVLETERRCCRFLRFVLTFEGDAQAMLEVAAYSGFFIAMALLWGWQIDKVVPDRYDLIGAGIAMVGVCVITYWPRA